MKKEDFLNKIGNIDDELIIEGEKIMDGNSKKSNN